eukprot:Tbor_TRINITY_DN5187_c4_g1::TRINITY_DN5187_c4_g1_i1::g.25587::m.25587/K03000/RPA12, ZNRD1; DNA-directed RNA polymerase I subunit RPA12
MSYSTYNDHKFVMGTLACPVCGFLLPLTTSRSQHSRCRHCSMDIGPSTTSSDPPINIYELMTLHEDLSATMDNGNEAIGTSKGNDNRVIEEAFCEKCNLFRPCHSYARQTRGADEGQTIFFECTVCKSEWTLNS